MINTEEKIIELVKELSLHEAAHEKRHA